MADLPNTPIAAVPAEAPADAEFPSLVSITVADLVGPLAANRQHVSQRTRTLTLRDRVNKIITDLTFIETGGPGGLNAFLPRDGGQAMAAALNFGGFKGINLGTPTAAADAVTKSYVDGFTPAGPGARGDIKIVTTGTLAIDVERADVLDGSGVKVLRLRNENLTLTTGSGAAGDKDYAGAISNAWHYVYAIGDTSGSLVDSVIASLNAGPGFGGPGPTLPGTYDVFRLIGQFYVASGAILPFRQINGEVLYDDTSLTAAFPYGAEPLAGAAPTAWTLLSLAPYVPPIAERAIVGFRFETPGGNNSGFEFRSLGGPSSVARTVAVYDGANDTVGAVNSVGSDGEFRLHVDTSQRIEWRRVLGGAGHNVEVVVRGFVPDLHYDT